MRQEINDWKYQAQIHQQQQQQQKNKEALYSKFKFLSKNCNQFTITTNHK